MLIVSSPSVSKPGLTCCSRQKLRISSPAPISNATESATSATTKALRSRWRRALPPAPAVPSFSVSIRLGFDVCSAGTRPKMSPVRSADTIANTRTRPSIVSSSSRGNASGALATTSFVVRNAIPAPMTPAMTARSSASTSSCVTIRDRSAPSAARIEISRWRCAPRASSRLATLPQAMSSTTSTAPVKMINAWRVSSGTSQS